MTVRHRKSTALRQIQSAIQQGLQAHLTTINTDLASEGVNYRFNLASFAPDTIAAMSASQGPEHPEDTLFPAMRVVRQPGQQRLLESGGVGEGKWAAQVWFFADRSCIEARLNSADVEFVELDELDDDDLAETYLKQAQCDIEEAIRWCLTAHMALGLAGVVGISSIETEHETEDYQGEGNVTAMVSILTLHLTQRMIWRSTP